MRQIAPLGDPKPASPRGAVTPKLRHPFPSPTLAQSAFHLAATAFGRAGLWQQGVRLAAMATEQGVALLPSTLTSLLGACAKGARWREALDILDRHRPVLRKAISSSSPTPDSDGRVGGSVGERREGRGEENVVCAYTLAMVACRAANRHSEGLQVLAMLEEDGGVGDEAFFRAALKCCAKAGGAGARRREGDETGGEGGGAVADRVLEGMAAQGVRCGVEGFTDVAQVRPLLEHSAFSALFGTGERVAIGGWMVNYGDSTGWTGCGSPPCV